MAVPILTALAALGLLTCVSTTRRWIVAVLAGIPYLAAAAYAESAFKEPILSLLLVGVVVALQGVRRQRFAPLSAVLCRSVCSWQASYTTTRIQGLVWPAVVLACWLAFEFVLGGMWGRLRATTGRGRAALPALIAGACRVRDPGTARHRTHPHVLGQQQGTSVGTVGGVTSTALANLAGPLHALEGLNVWLTGDFRFVPANALRAGVLAGMAFIVLAFALVSALRRRDLVWPAAMLALGADLPLHVAPSVAVRCFEGAHDPGPATGARLRRGAHAVARRGKLAIARDCRGRRWVHLLLILRFRIEL